MKLQTLPHGFPLPISEVWVPCDPQPRGTPLKIQGRWYEGLQFSMPWKMPYQPGDVIGLAEEWRLVSIYCINSFDHSASVWIGHRDQSWSHFSINDHQLREMLDVSHYSKDWQPASTMPPFAVRHRYTVQSLEPREVAGITESEALGATGWKYANCPFHKAPEKSFLHLWHSANLPAWAWRLQVVEGK